MNIVIIFLLILIAVVLLCTYFIIRTFNDIYQREDKIKLIETVVQSMEPSNKSDQEWYIQFDNRLNKLHRACFFNEGEVDEQLRILIKELTSWLLRAK